MPSEDEKSPRRYKYGTLNTVNTNTESILKSSPIDTLREIISNHRTEPEEDVRIWSGVVLKVLSTAEMADYDHYGKNSVRNAENTPTRQCIVRIPELDAAIPEPLTSSPENPGFDDIFIELHRVFTINDPSLPTPSPGDIVDCDFRNRKLFSEGFISAIHSKPAQKTGGVIKSETGGATSAYKSPPFISTTESQKAAEDWSGDARRWPEDKKIRSLEPVLGQKVQIILQNMRKRGFNPKIFFGWRSVQKQRELKAKGASRVSFSYHNNEQSKGVPASMGVDIVDAKILWGAKEPVEVIAPFWKALGEEVRKVGGLTWGGDWKPRRRQMKDARNRTLWEDYKIGWDPAHIELKGYRLSEVRKRNNDLQDT